jgi:hypothetical protein
MTQPFKVCPCCQQSSALDSTSCAQCGHQYRTYFGADDMTQAVYPSPAVALWRNPRKRAALLMAAGLFLVVVAFSLRHDPGPQTFLVYLRVKPYEGSNANGLPYWDRIEFFPKPTPVIGGRHAHAVMHCSDGEVDITYSLDGGAIESVDMCGLPLIPR